MSTCFLCGDHEVPQYVAAVQEEPGSRVELYLCNDARWCRARAAGGVLIERYQGIRVSLDDPRPEAPYGPGALCGECGHFAGRHSAGRCHFPRETPCKCKGFLWQGVRWDIVNGTPQRQPDELGITPAPEPSIPRELTGTGADPTGEVAP